MNIVCFGDSITHAAGFAEGDRWPTILQYKLNEWKSGKFKVYNRGKGGDTTVQGLDRFDTDVLPLLPSVVLIQFGFNDSNVRDWATFPRVSLDEYSRNLIEFHRMIIAKKGRPVFIVNHRIARVAFVQGNRKSYNTNFKPYNPALKEVAKKMKALIIDLPAIMTKRKIDLKKFVIEDGLHLSEKGNHIYADMVFEALKKIL